MAITWHIRTGLNNRTSLNGAEQRERLRIALTVDPEIPVPPVRYGGIERIVDILARGLVGRGHEVTVFAHPASTTTGKLVPWPGRASRSEIDIARNSATLWRHVFSRRFDLVHSFSRVAYLAPLLPLPIPKLMTYQREISPRSVQLGHALSRGTLWFSAISRQLMRNVADIGTWRLVYNGVPLAAYDFQPDPGPDAPLVFLGRVEEIKGPHLAIEVARRSRIPLVIAGNVPAEHHPFFEQEIRPHLDGSQVTYIGPVDDKTKNLLLGHARALLMPILWEEPFGIVMAEAMACGTPVIGLARGAVSEVVKHGVTGYVVHDVDGIVAAVRLLDQISREDCRTRVERLFSDTTIVEGYLAIYQEMRAARRMRSVAA
jgi:glycosyltransferase involved in cell wall biosynthesis